MSFDSAFSGRHIDDLRLILELACEPLPDEAVDCAQKGGKRLARAGRRGDQHVLTGLDGRPSVSLRRRRPGEASIEPRADRGVKQVECHGGKAFAGLSDKALAKDT